MKKFFTLVAFFVALICSAKAQERPNVIFILIDDMGYSDYMNRSNFYETPNLDSLAKSGMQFTNAYTSVSICAPARASAMTGKHPLRLGMWNHYHHMPEGSKTVASYLKEVGYATWHVGKWHCGNEETKTLPQHVGFDVNIAGWESWAPANYFWPYKKNKNIPEDKVPTRSRVPGLEKGGKEGEYLTDRLTDEAIKLINNHDGKSPFFLNMWHYAVHFPLQAKQDKIDKYVEKAKKYAGKNMEFFYDEKGTRYFNNPNMSENNSVAIYAAMLESLDENIGKLISALKEKGVYENTLIVFYSDNGPTTNRVIRTPFRGGKNSTYDGGLREPAFVVWANKIKPNTENDSFITICDIPYTILEAAKTSFPEAYEGDGKSIMKLALGLEDNLPNRDFYWYFPSTRTQWGQYASAAYKDAQDFKYQMLFNGSSDELYDLKSDPTESNNLIKAMPEKAKELENKLRNTLAEYYSKMPKPDEAYIENVERRLRGEAAIVVKDINY